MQLREMDNHRVKTSQVLGGVEKPVWSCRDRSRPAALGQSLVVLLSLRLRPSHADAASMIDETAPLAFGNAAAAPPGHGLDHLWLPHVMDNRHGQVRWGRDREHGEGPVREVPAAVGSPSDTHLLVEPASYQDRTAVLRWSFDEAQEIVLGSSKEPPTKSTKNLALSVTSLRSPSRK